MTEHTDRLEIATKLLAGFCANPNVFAYNSMCGWGLVNCNEIELVKSTLQLADKLITESELASKHQIQNHNLPSISQDF